MSREEAMKAVIETGMALRRDDIELGRKLERERIVQLLLDGEFVNPKLGNTGLMAVLFHVQGNADWLSDKDIEALHNRIIDTIDPEEE